MTHPRIFRMFAVLLGVLLLATACAADDGGNGGGGDGAGSDDADETSDTSSEGADESLSIELGISVSRPDADLFPYTAAEALGYFDEENLTVEVVPTGGSGDLIEQLVAGNIPVGTPNMLTLARAMGTGDLGLQNYYTMAYGTNFGIFVPEDSPLEEISELEGKTIGVTEPGGGEFAVLVAALGDAGLGMEDISTIPIGGGDAATFNALDRGQVDAYAASLQDVFALQIAGMEIREITPELFTTDPQRGLIVLPDTLENDREALVRLARAWAKATLFCDTNPDACADFQAEADPETWEENEEGLSIGGLQYKDSLPNLTVPDDEPFGRHYEDSYEELIEEMNRTVEDFEPWSVEDFLVDDLLEEINDFDEEAVIGEAEGFDG